ncbi:MAG: helix-turn-helix domain-containing protein [Haloarculaceae archaeon]
MSEPRLVETADPEEVFTALADGTRMAILHALWEAEEGTASFSELREAVGMRDSGQFNYHLDKLRDRFVRKTDDGYRLTLAGMQVKGAVFAGAYTMEGSVEPFELDEPCPACGGVRTFHYEDERVEITCGDCGFSDQAGIAPGVFVGYDREAFPDVAGRYFRTIVRRVDDGFCWVCDGRIEPTIQAAGETDDDAEASGPDLANLPVVRFDCGRCGESVVVDLGVVFLDHPAVVSFLYERGVDVREESFWTFSARNTDRASFRSRDPVRAGVTYSTDGDALTLVVDGDLAVVDIEGP